MSTFGKVFHVERRQLLEYRAEVYGDIEYKNTYRMFIIFQPHKNEPKLTVAPLQK